MGHFEESSSLTTNEYIHFGGDSPTMGWSLCVDDGGGCPCVFSSVSLTYTTVPGSTKVHQFQQANSRMMSSLGHCGLAIQTSILVVAPFIKQRVASVRLSFLKGCLSPHLTLAFPSVQVTVWQEHKHAYVSRLMIHSYYCKQLMVVSDRTDANILKVRIQRQRSTYSYRYLSDVRKEVVLLVVCLLSTTVLQPRWLWYCIAVPSVLLSMASKTFGYAVLWNTCQTCILPQCRPHGLFPTRRQTMPMSFNATFFPERNFNRIKLLKD